MKRKASSTSVRARFKGDLERLCAKHGVPADIKETPGNDYRYRMDFARDIWADIVMDEALGIDYDNFKNAVHDGTARDRAYMDVWWQCDSAKNKPAAKTQNKPPCQAAFILPYDRRKKNRRGNALGGWGLCSLGETLNEPLLITRVSSLRT